MKEWGRQWLSRNAKADESLKTRLLFVLFLLAMIALPLPGGVMGQEASLQSPRKLSSKKAGGKESDNVGSWLVSLYRDHISKIDGDRCPSFPSCSTYSVQAFRKHGFFIGWMMTVDRLFHEGSEEKDVSPLVYDHGRLKIYDPLKNNDFWWYTSSTKPHE